MFLFYEPFKDEGKWSYDSSGKGMAINNKNIVAHPTVEGNLGDDVHACIAKLQSNHGKVVFRVLKEVCTKPRLFSGHFLLLLENLERQN